MKFTLRIKSVNPEFDREQAEQYHGGRESEDNVLYLWEDELLIPGEVASFKVRNNVPFPLEVEENGKPATYEIPACTIIDCVLENGRTTHFAFSKRIIKETEKNQSKDGKQLWFTVYLKGKMKVVSPFEGAYFAKEDFPFNLPEVEAEEEDDEEKEETD